MEVHEMQFFSGAERLQKLEGVVIPLDQLLGGTDIFYILIT